MAGLAGLAGMMGLVGMASKMARYIDSEAFLQNPLLSHRSIPSYVIDKNLANQKTRIDYGSSG